MSRSYEIEGRVEALLDGLRRRIEAQGWVSVGEGNRGAITDAALIEAALDRLESFGPMPLLGGEAGAEAAREAPGREGVDPDVATVAAAPRAIAWPPAPPIDLPAAPPICPKCGTREITPGGADLCAECMVQRALGF